MPQPFARVNPKAQLMYDRDSGPSKHRPKLALLAMAVISDWTHLELWLRNVFLSMLGTNPRPGAAVYTSLSSTAAQKSALTAVAKLALDPELAEVFEALLFLFSRVARMRNKIAHWQWAYSPQSPDAVILIDPDAIFEQTIWGRDTQAHIAKIRAGQNTGNPWAPMFDSASLYYAKDFLEIASDIKDVTQLLILFDEVFFYSPRNSTYPMRNLMQMQGSNPDAIDSKYRTLLDQLKAQPPMAAALSRRRKHPKNSQEEPSRSPDEDPPQ